VTAVRTEVPVLVAFGQLVMFYWQLRLLNRWTHGTRRSCSGRRYMNELAEWFHGWAGKLPRAPVASFLQAADVLPRNPVLTGECLKDIKC
jgi:hypothetical protein